VTLLNRHVNPVNPQPLVAAAAAAAGALLLLLMKAQGVGQVHAQLPSCLVLLSQPHAASWLRQHQLLQWL
jgi:hypothetical protein